MKFILIKRLSSLQRNTHLYIWFYNFNDIDEFRIIISYSRYRSLQLAILFMLSQNLVKKIKKKMFIVQETAAYIFVKKIFLNNIYI